MYREWWYWILESFFCLKTIITYRSISVSISTETFVLRMHVNKQYLRPLSLLLRWKFTWDDVFHFLLSITMFNISRAKYTSTPLRNYLLTFFKQFLSSRIIMLLLSYSHLKIKYKNRTKNSKVYYIKKLMGHNKN